MSFDLQSALRPTETAQPEILPDLDLGPNWGERIVTAVATSIAVLIVASIAVLMGMA